MSSIEAEERLSFGRRWGGAPEQHMLASLEYAQRIDDNHGFYLKFGYGW